MSFIALDFETANSNRSSICEVGLAFIEDGKIVDTRSWLVKPLNNYYDTFNISIHGINPEDTLNSPEFNELWEEIRPLIEGKIIVAHNAAFDMYALKDVLNLYGLEYPNIKTFCSCTLAKRTLPGLISYSLAPVCNYLNIPLANHHRASDDAEACANICLKISEKCLVTDLSMLLDTHRIIMGIMSKDSKTYTAPQSKRDYTKKLDAKNIIGDCSKQDSDNLFHGKSVAFTGTLTSMQRKNAMQIIADIGGFPENDITFKTNFLVVGQQNFNVVGESGLSGKQKKALQLLQNGQSIEIISEQDFIQNIYI